MKESFDLRSDWENPKWRGMAFRPFRGKILYIVNMGSTWVFRVERPDDHKEEFEFYTKNADEYFFTLYYGNNPMSRFFQTELVSSKMEKLMERDVK